MSRSTLLGLAAAFVLLPLTTHADASERERHKHRTWLAGVASAQKPLGRSTIRICDANGTARTTATDKHGVYAVDATGLVPPLLIAATTGPLPPKNGAIAYAALRDSLQASTLNIANVNQLTDKIASDVAVEALSLRGSVQLIAACKPAGISKEIIAAKTAALNALIATALAEHGGKSKPFDPVSADARRPSYQRLLASVYHNRDGFSDSVTTEWGATNLFDRNMQVLDAEKNVVLDPTLRSWHSYRTRIFIVGDSTASNYSRQVAPRMGWGQVFDRFIRENANVKVVNLAQSGRSSRSFIGEGWFKLMEENIEKGDYVLIQFGHNDEKCGAKATVDIENRCTYPGKVSDTTDKGLPADYSFQYSLEKYIGMARAKGATPLLITPVTRIVQDKSVTTHVEGLFPIAATTHLGPADAAVNPRGDYSQTVRDTAAANNVTLIDLDAKSISFANSINVGSGGPVATGGWRDYYLAVSDFTTYPFYANPKTTGHYLNADRTHFQEAGALKMAQFIVSGIRADQTRQQGFVKLFKRP